MVVAMAMGAAIVANVIAMSLILVIFTKETNAKRSKNHALNMNRALNAWHPWYLMTTTHTMMQ